MVRGTAGEKFGGGATVHELSLLGIPSCPSRLDSTVVNLSLTITSVIRGLVFNSVDQLLDTFILLTVLGAFNATALSQGRI